MFGQTHVAGSKPAMIGLMLLLAGLSGGTPAWAQASTTGSADTARPAAECSTGTAPGCHAAPAGGSHEDARAEAGVRINKLNICAGSDQARSVRAHALCRGRPAMMLAAL